MVAEMMRRLRHRREPVISWAEAEARRPQVDTSPANPVRMGTSRKPVQATGIALPCAIPRHVRLKQTGKTKKPTTALGMLRAKHVNVVRRTSYEQRTETVKSSPAGPQGAYDGDGTEAEC